MKSVEIFTDGACKGNPGPGGWAAIIKYDNNTSNTLIGGKDKTTNNRMELTSVIEALKSLKESCIVTLTSDSKYVIDSITKKWVYKWQNTNWIKPDKKPALNSDLWGELLPLLEKHQVTFNWVRGHSGHPENEICDKLAVEYYQTHFKS